MLRKALLGNRSSNRTTARPHPGPYNVWNEVKPAHPPVPAPGGGTYSIGPCDQVTGNGYCCPKEWYVDQRVRIMHHPKPRGTVVGEFGTTGIGQDVNDAGEIEFVNKFVRPSA